MIIPEFGVCVRSGSIQIAKKAHFMRRLGLQVRGGLVTIAVGQERFSFLKYGL